MEWIKFLETAAAFSLPLAADFFALPIFLPEWKGLFKTIPSLFATGIYMYIRFLSDPNIFFIGISLWWIFFIIAFGLLIIYISAYLRNKRTNDVDKSRGLLIQGLIVFTLFYTTLTMGFCLLFQTISYTLVKVKVVEEGNNKPVTGAFIRLQFGGGDNVPTESTIGEETNAKGVLQRYYLTDNIKKITGYSVSTTDDYYDILNVGIDESRLLDLQHIKVRHK